MSAADAQFVSQGQAGTENEPSRLQLNPVEQELMEVKHRINEDFEEIRHSVGCLLSFCR